VSKNGDQKHRRLFTSRTLLAIFLLISLYQYVTAGQVTWLTHSFRLVENSARTLWVDPKGFVRGSADAVTAYASSVVDSVAKQASSGAPVTTPSFSIPKAEIAWSAPAYDLSGRVVKVADGDTLTLLDTNQKQHEIRLHGIDTPEYKQPYGRAATKALADLVAGEGVGVDVKDTDREGRTVGVVFKANVNVNLQMVRSGFAWWYKKYAPFDDDLRLAEQYARADKLGLWTDPNPVPPWEWRQANRVPGRDP
jgi:endonuclease YncB( thermonuclease family)